MKKRLTALALALALLLSLMTPASAWNREAPMLHASVENPLMEDAAAPEPAEAGESGETAPALYASYVSPEQAADQLRQAMVARQSPVILHVDAPGYWYRSQDDNWFTKELFPMVYSQALAQSPYDGDYLLWSWRRYDCTELERSGQSGHVFRVSLTYYTTAREEAEVAAEVERLTRELGLRELPAYDAYAAVHDYIVSTVSYDYAGIRSDDPYIFTAYAALTRGKAVCQGYAALYYALCRNAGLPVRISTSTTHAWNIVSLKNTWYNVDTTWDSSAVNRRLWFLRGKINFETRADHVFFGTYLEADFQQRYPVSLYDYDPDSPYNDVAPPAVNGHYRDILRATALGLVQGTGDYAFSPAGAVSRAMMVTVLWRMEGAPDAAAADYLDVSPGAYYAGAVAWATEAGIVEGGGDGYFRPNATATRAQLVTFLYRYADYLGKRDEAPSALEGYLDRDQVPDYALDAVGWGVSTGLVRGATDTMLAPRGEATRAQLASILVRFLDHYQLDMPVKDALPSGSASDR